MGIIEKVDGNLVRLTDGAGENRNARNEGQNGQPSSLAQLGTCTSFKRVNREEALFPNEPG